MTKISIERAIRNIRLRWPSLLWSRSEYESHIVLCSSNSDKMEPTQLEDLYLGGSAGYRIDEAWSLIHTELSDKVATIMDRRANAALGGEELWSRTVERLIEDASEREKLSDGRFPAKIIRYRGLVKLMNYLITVASRIAISENRRSKSVSLSDLHVESSQFASDQKSPSQDICESDQAKRAISAIMLAHQNLTEEQQFLIMMVYRKGMTQKDAGKLLGISEFKASRLLKKAIANLQRAVANSGIEISSEVVNAFAEAFEVS